MRSDLQNADNALIPFVTLVAWAGCLTVGIAGLRLRYPWPVPPVRERSPVTAEALHVDVTDGPAPPPQTAAPAAQALTADAPAPPPSASQLPAATAAPAFAAVAAAPSAVAFAVPGAGPTRGVEAQQAAPVAPTPSSNVPQKLTFGQGEGRQPAPEYPRDAVLARQQGTVIVRFTVDASGRIQKAEAAAPCSSALLNQAAVRAVRESWRFPAGPARDYEVAIEFKLNAR